MHLDNAPFFGGWWASYSMALPSGSQESYNNNSPYDYGEPLSIRGLSIHLGKVYED